MKNIMKKKDKGQTLVLVVIFLLILMFGVVFLFDYQSVIRGKMKSQNAADAASLTGAFWQKNTLNLIGELNLVKACDVLITDEFFSPIDEYYDDYDPDIFLEIEMAEVNLLNSSFEPLQEGEYIYSGNSQKWGEDATYSDGRTGLPEYMSCQKQYSKSSYSGERLEFEILSDGLIYLITTSTFQYSHPHNLPPLSPPNPPWDTKTTLRESGWIEMEQIRRGEYKNDYYWKIYSKWCFSGERYNIATDSNNIPPILITSSALKNEKTDIDYLETSVNFVTEMQQRLSFVGPLIGLGAAQQAAKNNGIPTNQSYQDLANLHIFQLEENFYTEPSVKYADMYQPYINMLKTIRDSGHSVFVYPDNLNYPSFYNSPFISYLTNESFYDAISEKDWCYFTSVSSSTSIPGGKILETMHGWPADNKWWGDIKIVEESLEFPDESEYLALNLVFTSNASGYRSTENLDVMDELRTKYGLEETDHNYWSQMFKTDNDPFRSGLSTESATDSYVGRKDRVFDTPLTNPNPITTPGYNWNRMNRSDFPFVYIGGYVLYETKIISEDPLVWEYKLDKWGFRIPVLNASYNLEDNHNGTWSMDIDSYESKFDMKYAALPRIIWADYDSSWTDYSESYIEDWDSYFNDNGLLIPEYSYFGTGVQIKSELLDYPTFFSKKLETHEDREIGDEIFFKDYKYGNEKLGKKLSKAEKKMKEAEIKIEASSLAKPIGSLTRVLNSNLTPNSSNLVLPVFEKYSQIPVYLEHKFSGRSFDVKWFMFLRFYLPTLGTVDNISDMPQAMVDAGYADFWDEVDWYHGQLVKFNDPEWRKEGWNTDPSNYGWINTPTEFDEETGEESKWQGNDCYIEAPIGPPPGPGPGPPSGPPKMM